MSTPKDRIYSAEEMAKIFLKHRSIVILVASIVFFLVVIRTQIPGDYGRGQLWYSLVSDVPVSIGAIPEEFNWRHLSLEEMKKMSELGRRIFMTGMPRNGIRKPQSTSEKNYTILVWKHGPSLARRFVRWFGKKDHDPFELCSVRNCRLTYKDEDLNVSDAVMVHLHKTKGPEFLPKWRNPNQRWIFLTDESPYHTFMSSKKYKLKDYNGLFNWSMAYRMDADVPVPYGRTVPLSAGDKVPGVRNFAREKKKFAAIMGSNCGGKNGRWKYVKELQKHVPVDAYGRCGKLKCPGHYESDCRVLRDYKFYLAFENSNCREYVTEKLWWNAFQKESVPVVMGGEREHYERLLPPKSFVHVDDFRSPKELAEFLKRLNASESEYNSYFDWKKDFKVVNEHGYFQTPVFHYCRICEALNYNDPSPKVYNHLENFWSAGKDCSPPKWVLK